MRKKSKPTPEEMLRTHCQFLHRMAEPDNDTAHIEHCCEILKKHGTPTAAIDEVRGQMEWLRNTMREIDRKAIREDLEEAFRLPKKKTDARKGAA